MQKKKVIKRILIAFAIAFAVFFLWNLTDCASVTANGNTTEISFSDSWRLRCLLSLDKTNFHEYACGFWEDYSIKIGGLTYCLAQDDCNSVYIKELNFYYSIKDLPALEELLESYGINKD